MTPGGTTSSKLVLFSKCDVKASLHLLSFFLTKHGMPKKIYNANFKEVNTCLFEWKISYDFKGC